MTQALQTTTGIQAAVRRAGTQAGISLLELIAALTVIAAIIVGALALYTAASSSQGSTQLVQDLVAIRSAVREIHQGQANYGIAGGTDLRPVLINARRVPSTIRVNGGALLHQFSTAAGQGDITVVGAGGQYTITINRIPQDVCIKLLTTASGWVSVRAPGGNVQTPPNLPVSAATANAECTGPGNVVFIGT